MKHIALLRAVNLGSHKKVAMADLRDFFTDLGFDDPRTLLNSGNVVFGSTGTSPAQLERLLEAEARRRLKLDTDIMVRTARGWRALMAKNPFPKEAKADPAHLVVVCLKTAPAKRAEADLEAAIKGREVVRVVGKEAFIVYPDGIGNSKLTGALIDKTLATAGTGRNWNTIRKLADLVAE